MARSAPIRVSTPTSRPAPSTATASGACAVASSSSKASRGVVSAVMRDQQRRHHVLHLREPVDLDTVALRDDAHGPAVLGDDGGLVAALGDQRSASATVWVRASSMGVSCTVCRAFT